MKLDQAILRFVLTLLIVSASFSSQASQEERLPIIDMHLHAMSIKDWLSSDGKPAPRLSFPDGFTKEYSAATTDKALLELTLAEMDRFKIVKGFVSGSLEKVYEWHAAAPSRFIPSPEIRGTAETPQIDFLRSELRAGRIQALGELTGQYYGLSPNDPALEPYFELAEEMDVPVLIHTLGIGGPIPTFRSHRGSPLLLEEVLVKHPRLRIWVENAGYPFLQEMVALMYQYPQVYADLSTITWIIPQEAFHDYLRGLIRAGLGKRLMFGSDQMIWPETISMAVEGIESADFLSQEQKRDIFYNNAARFLRLSGPKPERKD